MVNKFTTGLNKSSREIRGQRAVLVGSATEAAQEEIIQSLEKRKRELLTKKLNLEDFYPSKIGSTVPVKNDFDPVEWARDMQKVKVDLAMLDVELKIAKETYDEWFKEIPGEDDIK